LGVFKWLLAKLSIRFPKNWTDLEFVALDIETSGLDAKRDRILSIAWVVIRPPLIDYSTGEYFVIHDGNTELNQSTVLHGLVTRDFVQAEHIASVLEQLQKVLTNRILVGHNIEMDWRFLQNVARAHKINLNPLKRFDTLNFEHKKLTRLSAHFPRGALTLESCRKRYGLPYAAQHHAFSDALACAELFVAQIYQFAGRSSFKL